MRKIGIEERRSRLGRRHHLARPKRARDVVEATGGVVALHGTDPASVYLAALARMRDPSIGAIEQALYEERTLLRLLGMRRTMFVLPVDCASVVQASCAPAIADQQRRLLLRLIEEAGISSQAETWLASVEEATLAALDRLGEASAAELAVAEPRLGEQLLLAAGKPYEARQSISTRVLLLLGAEGRVVRGRPRGSWISTQYRWSAVHRWLPGWIPELTAAEAEVELVRRWLGAFGPGTAADLRWWTGWTARQVARALAEVGAVEVELDGGTAWVLPGDEEPVAAPEPWAALLPALDPTVMGWSGRRWFLGDHGPGLFDRSGNAGPTVWWDGRVVGGWAQAPGGEIRIRLLEDVGADAVAAIEAERERLAGWIGDVRIVPRFRTPLERELSA